MPTKKKITRGRKPNPHRLVDMGRFFVTPRRAFSMFDTQKLTGKTPSQQAAAALDECDPLPAPQKESTG